MKTMYGTTLQDRQLIKKLNNIARIAERLSASLQAACADVRDGIGNIDDERWMGSGYCTHCGSDFDAFRADAKFCSPKCQRAARKKAVEKVGDKS